MTSVAGGPGDPIMPRRIKAGTSWCWDETDDDQVEKLRVWWKERCEVQTGATKKTNFKDANSSFEQDQKSERDEIMPQNALFKSPAPQVQGGSSSKKQKAWSASINVLNAEQRVVELRKFMEEEKLSSFHKHLIAFKDLLVRKGISKVLISGFGNGEGGHVKVPESLLGTTMADSQMLFVFCRKGIPSLVTEKLVMARAFGLRIVDSRFLVKWGESTILPGLEEHPVKNEWSSNSTGLEKSLHPLSDKIFTGQRFAFYDTKHWLIKSDKMASMITHLGGLVVGPEEQGTKGFGLSSSPVPQVEVFHPDWVVHMVLAGQDLPNVRWRLMQAQEENVCPASQVTRPPYITSCEDFWCDV